MHGLPPREGAAARRSAGSPRDGGRPPARGRPGGAPVAGELDLRQTAQHVGDPTRLQIRQIAQGPRISGRSKAGSSALGTRIWKTRPSRVSRRLRTRVQSCVHGGRRVAQAGGLPSRKKSGGEGGIRTPDALAGMPHFECGAFNHSATSPGRARTLWSRRARTMHRGWSQACWAASGRRSPARAERRDFRFAPRHRRGGMSVAGDLAPPLRRGGGA